MNDAQQRTLASVLDTIVPPDAERGLPGAGALGLAASVVEALGEAGALIGSALEELEHRAQGEGAASLAALAAADRERLVLAFAEERPDFQGALSFHTYATYYQHPQVQEAIGLEARPPFPGGYPLEMGDLSLLDRVRARQPLYRVPDEG